MDSTPAICETLRQYLTYRKQLIDIQAIVRSQLHAFEQNPKADPNIHQAIQTHYDDLTLKIVQLKQAIHTLVKSDSDWQHAANILLLIPGIATISTAWLLVATHCFARCDTPEQAASFAGLAPHAKDSGNAQGKRYIGGTGHEALSTRLLLPPRALIPFSNPTMTNWSHLANPKKLLAVLFPEN